MSSLSKISGSPADVNYQRLKRSNTSTVEEDDDVGIGKKNHNSKGGKKKSHNGRSSRDLSSESEHDDDILSNEARRAGFAAMKKRGTELRQSLTKKLLSDPAKFDKLLRKWRDADEDGFGLIDKETFVDVLFIQLRSKNRPTPEETEWLCRQLKTKNKLIAYREARNVIAGDYFDGSSYMPMWATARMPYVPSPYMPAMMNMMGMTVGGGSSPFDATTSMSYYAPANTFGSTTSMSGPGGFTRRMSMNDYGRPVPHADTVRPSSSSATAAAKIRRPASERGVYSKHASKPPKAATNALSLPIGSKVKAHQHHPQNRHHRHDNEDGQRWRHHHHHHKAEEENGESPRGRHDQQQEGREGAKGRRGVSSAKTWPDSDSDTDGSEAWAALPGTVGEWLRYVASPLERRNFEELLQTLEDFEFDRGLQQRDGGHAPDGVILRLGSMLHAKITFHVST